MPALSRTIFRDAQRTQPKIASILHPPSTRDGNRPNRAPSTQNCALPGEAEVQPVAFEVHVPALLLARTKAFQSPLQFAQFLSLLWQFRAGSTDILLHQHAVCAVERESILDLREA